MTFLKYFGDKKIFERFTEIVVLRDVTHHSATPLPNFKLTKGLSLDKVATLLGHTNLNTKRIYTTPGMQDLEDAINELGNL